MVSKLVTRLAGLALTLLIAAPLAAQQSKVDKLKAMTPEQIQKLSDAELRDLLKIDPIPEAGPTMTQPFFRGAPGTSSGSPSGFGAAWRDAYVGGGYQQGTNGGASDGSMAAGFGLGNPKDAVGLDVTISSLSSFRSGLFNRTGFSFKAHRMVSSSAAIAVGVENAIVSDNDKNSKATVYIAATKAIAYAADSRIKSLTISAGLGNGRLRFEKDQIKDNKTVNAFASIGAQLHPQFSVLADWTGPDLAAGFSVVPIKAFPIIITPTLNNLTGQNGNDIRFSLGFGIGMKF